MKGKLSTLEIIFMYLSIFYISYLFSSETIYRRPTTPTNFRVKVYPNGERNRFAYCKSCSMELVR